MAASLDIEVLEARKRVLGEGHPYTLISIANLASTWKGHGCLVDALDLERKCLDLQLRDQGAGHPNISFFIALLPSVTAIEGGGVATKALQRKGAPRSILALRPRVTAVRSLASSPIGKQSSQRLRVTQDLPPVTSLPIPGREVPGTEAPPERIGNLSG